MPGTDSNHENHERRERREKTRQELKRWESSRALHDRLERRIQEGFARNLSVIQSVCDHDWEHGMGPGRRCAVCGLTEI
jgi:hypothetical protein